MGQYVLLGKCFPRSLLTHHRICRAGRCFMPDNIPLCFSRPFRVSRIHLSWTDFHLWKAQGANVELANSGVLWQVTSELHDDWVWDSSQHMDVETLSRCCGVGFWQFGQKSVPQCHAASHFVGNSSASSESPSRQSKIPVSLMCCGPCALLSRSPRILASLSKSPPSTRDNT